MGTESLRVKQTCRQIQIKPCCLWRYIDVSETRNDQFVRETEQYLYRFFYLWYRQYPTVLSTFSTSCFVTRNVLWHIEIYIYTWMPHKRRYVRIFFYVYIYIYIYIYIHIYKYIYVLESDVVDELRRAKVKCRCVRLEEVLWCRILIILHEHTLWNICQNRWCYCSWWCPSSSPYSQTLKKWCCVCS